MDSALVRKLKAHLQSLPLLCTRISRRSATSCEISVKHRIGLRAFISVPFTTILRKIEGPSPSLSRVLVQQSLSSIPETQAASDPSSYTTIQYANVPISRSPSSTATNYDALLNFIGKSKSIRQSLGQLRVPPPHRNFPSPMIATNTKPFNAYAYKINRSTEILPMRNHQNQYRFIRNYSNFKRKLRIQQKLLDNKHPSTLYPSVTPLPAIHP